jgi:hypothetical protein
VRARGGKNDGDEDGPRWSVFADKLIRLFSSLKHKQKQNKPFCVALLVVTNVIPINSSSQPHSLTLSLRSMLWEINYFAFAFYFPDLSALALPLVPLFSLHPRHTQSELHSREELQVEKSSHSIEEIIVEAYPSPRRGAKQTVAECVSDASASTSTPALDPGAEKHNELRKLRVKFFCN